MTNAQLRRLLTRLAANTIDRSPFVFEYSTGNDFVGLTEYEFTGEGWVRIKSNVTPGNVNLWEIYRVGADDVDKMLSVFVRSQAWLVNPKRDDPFPDEKPASLGFRYRDDEWTQSGWLEDVKKQRPFRIVRAAVLKSASALTGGTVLDA